MNLKQFHKRQRKYASILYAKRKIDAWEFGMMISGCLEYSPGSASLFGWVERNPWVTGWPVRRFYRHVGEV